MRGIGPLETGSFSDLIKPKIPELQFHLTFFLLGGRL